MAEAVPRLPRHGERWWGVSKVAWSRNCLVCPHFARRHQGALEGPDCPCPQDHQGVPIRPDRVKRSMPPGWKCPTLAKVTPGAGETPALPGGEICA